MIANADGVSFSKAPVGEPNEWSTWFEGWPQIKFPDVEVPAGLVPVVAALAAGIAVGFALSKIVAGTAANTAGQLGVEPVTPRSACDIDAQAAP